MTEWAALGNLEDRERQTWEQAVEYYRERVIASDLLFDQRLIAVRTELAAIACYTVHPDNLDTKLRVTLTEAMPVYRRHWWPEHHAANMAWIREQLDALKKYEAVFAKRLADAYGGEWPVERVRVDVTAYANWTSAYTTNHPD